MVKLFVVVSLTLLGRILAMPVENQLKHKEVDNGISDIRLGIVISPLMSYDMMREIGIYWNIDEVLDSDRLTLYDGEPEMNGTEAILSFEPNATLGFYKTGISAEFVPTSKLTFNETCLKYHVAWTRNGTSMKKKCLATHPNWMNERRSILGSKRLNEICIPGSHDSGAFSKKEKYELETLIDKYIITQDEDVLSQLIHGVRYLDIRVGSYPSTDELWWVNHGFFRVHPLKLVIDDVKLFLDNTQEIVIFDVQEFPVGFSDNTKKIHEKFVSYLEDQFAGYYLMRNNSNNWGMSLNDVWSTGKRLIIGYDHKKVWPEHNSTWPPVTHRWPNVKTLDELYVKIENFENGSDPVDNYDDPGRPPSSVMAQLTPDAVDALMDLLGGLRHMAEGVNMNITDSYNDLWKCSANIVSIDYIKSSGIIETALELNDKRLSIC